MGLNAPLTMLPGIVLGAPDAIFGRLGTLLRRRAAVAA